MRVIEHNHICRQPPANALRTIPFTTFSPPGRDVSEFPPVQRPFRIRVDSCPSVVKKFPIRFSKISAASRNREAIKIAWLPFLLSPTDLILSQHFPMSNPLWIRYWATLNFGHVGSDCCRRINFAVILSAFRTGHPCQTNKPARKPVQRQPLKARL